MPATTRSGALGGAPRLRTWASLRWRGSRHLSRDGRSCNPVSSRHESPSLAETYRWAGCVPRTAAHHRNSRGRSRPHAEGRRGRSTSLRRRSNGTIPTGWRQRPHRRTDVFVGPFGFEDARRVVDLVDWSAIDALVRADQKHAHSPFCARFFMSEPSNGPAHSVLPILGSLREMWPPSVTARVSGVSVMEFYSHLSTGELWIKVR